eukprot:364100-Chlamydomonas_euryale.AAC.81
MCKVASPVTAELAPNGTVGTCSCFRGAAAPTATTWNKMLDRAQRHRMVRCMSTVVLSCLRRSADVRAALPA